MTHKTLSSRCTTHNYVLAKIKSEKRDQKVAKSLLLCANKCFFCLLPLSPLICIMSYQGAASAGQRLGNLSCSQGYLQSTGSCSKESLKRSTGKGKLGGRQGKNRGKEPVSDLSITDVTNENVVHRVLGK